MQNNDTFISVIIPVYNVENYISACLDSVLRQNYRDYEIVVVDDESQDKTLQIVEKYAENNENIVVLKTEHGGQAKARNLGMQHASGQYITFLDGDDYWEGEHLEKLCDILVCSQCDICVANQYFVVHGGEKQIIKLFDIPESRTVSGKEIVFQNINIPGSMCLVTCRKGFLEEREICFQEDYICNEDFDFFMNAIINTEKVAVVGHLFYNYRRDNISSTYSNMSGLKILCFMRVYRKWYDYIYKQNEHIVQRENILNGITNNYNGAIGAVKSLPSSDENKTKAFDYLAQTQYILWPDQKPKKIFRFYLWKQGIRAVVSSYVGKMKNAIGKGK